MEVKVLFDDQEKSFPTVFAALKDILHQYPDSKPYVVGDEIQFYNDDGGKVATMWPAYPEEVTYLHVSSSSASEGYRRTLESTHYVSNLAVLKAFFI